MGVITAAGHRPGCGDPCLNQWIVISWEGELSLCNVGWRGFWYLSFMQSVRILDEDRNPDTFKTLTDLRYQWSKGINQEPEDICRFLQRPNSSNRFLSWFFFFCCIVPSCNALGEARGRHMHRGWLQKCAKLNLGVRVFNLARRARFFRRRRIGAKDSLTK